MSDKPIIMSAPMVRALLEGRKTQTRRILKGAPIGEGGAGHGWKAYNEGDMLVVQWPGFDAGAMERTVEERVIRPPYDIGDRLWVRETFITGWEAEGFEIRDTDENGDKLPQHVWYRADGDLDFWLDQDGNHEAVPWKPSIHMPRWASRLTLIVTDVRVERVQDISEEDVRAEGVTMDWYNEGKGDWQTKVKCPCCDGHGVHGALDGATLGVMEVDCAECDTETKVFSHLWNSLHKPGFQFDDNPFVAVLTFTVHHANIDALSEAA